MNAEGTMQTYLFPPVKLYDEDELMSGLISYNGVNLELGEIGGVCDEQGEGDCLVS